MHSLQTVRVIVLACSSLVGAPLSDLLAADNPRLIDEVEFVGRMPQDLIVFNWQGSMGGVVKRNGDDVAAFSIYPASGKTEWISNANMLGYRMTVFAGDGECLALFGAIYCVTNMNDEGKSVILKRVSDDECPRVAILKERGSLILPFQAVVTLEEQTLVFSGAAIERDQRHRAEIYVNPALLHNDGFSFPDHKESKPIAVGVGDSVAFKNEGKKYKVLSIVCPDKKDNVLGWIELSAPE